MLPKRKYILLVSLLTLLQLWVDRTYGQTITATVSSTPSVCFDDGSLTVNASGGAAPYTLTLQSGPADPNISYPTTLLPGVYTFGGLPNGTFTILITDNSGATATVTGTVGGSYQFPSLSFNTGALPNTIIAIEAGGRPPFQYAISSTGSNSGFGPFQASDTFTNLCPRNYWIRIIDSCGNIYTDEVTFSYNILCHIICVNFSKGTLDVTASGGTAPYTYSIGGMTNGTGNFTGLAPYFSDSLVITDACGVQYVQIIAPPTIGFTEKCPSDSIIYLSSLAYPISPDTFTFICTNCTPAQSVTLPYSSPIGTTPLFTNQPPGTTYNIVVLSSACGGDTVPHAPPSIVQDIVLSVAYLSCNSVIATVNNAGSPINVDSFILSYSASGPTLQSNTTGLFEKLPDSTYTITAYIAALCGDTPTTSVVIPHFGGGCFTLMLDSACHNTWEYSTSSIVPELYSLIFAAGDTVAGSANTATNANFYGLASDTSYILISDSGCAETLHTPPATAPVFSVIAYLPCVGQPIVQFTGPQFTYCNGSSAPSPSQIRIKLSYGDSLIFNGYEATGAPISINISQSGWYYYTIYAGNVNDTSAELRYDTICPLDTGSVYLDNTQIPFIYSTVAFVCDTLSHPDTVHYQVYGGAPPYTVEIPGYDTTVIQTNTGTFPTNRAGTYTVLVYDDCGISRSVTFTIVDTCSGCPYGIIVIPDTSACAGDTVHLTSVGIHAVSYQWYVNGVLYSTAADTSFVSAAGGSHIMLIVISATGCADTATTTIVDTCHGCPYTAISMPDSLYCVGNTVALSSGSISGISYLWLINGQPYSTAMDTVYTVTAAGEDTITLRVTSATACTDSAAKHITVLAPYVFSLGSDTTYCGPFSRVLRDSIAATVWSTGQTGAAIVVDTPGTYIASATNRCATTKDTVVISEKIIPVVHLGDDSALCVGSSLVLDAGDPGDTYLWSTGSTTRTITVDTTGTYSVSVTDNGCTGHDAVAVTFIPPPVAFSLGDDTTICSGYPIILEAYQPYSYYLWNTGDFFPFLTVVESGTYIVTDSNMCGKATDSITVEVEKCTCRVQIPTAFSPNNDGVNDKYGAVAPCIPLDFLLEIFDRWGQKLFSTTAITGRWDGTYRTYEQPVGVYVYVMKYRDPYTNISYTQSGNVTLIR